MATTPYMSLILPDVSATPGPEWATDLNIALSSVDSHDHSAGQGLKVPTSGINVNADLPFNGFNLITARTLRMSSLGAAPALGTDVGCLSNVNGNLTYNNNSGVAIQITAGSALNAASIGGIGGDYSTSTASLFYTSASKVFTFWQNTNTPAKIDTGDILLRNISTPTNAITLLAPSSLGAPYQLTLGGALPGGQSFMLIDASGNVSYSNALSGVTITSSNAASANVFIDNYTRSTGTSVGIRGVAISNSASFNTSSGTYVDVTNLTVTITTSGRPVFLVVIPDGNTVTQARIGASTTVSNATTPTAQFKWLRNGSDLAVYQIDMAVDTSATENFIAIDLPPGCVSYIDAVAAGTYTYKIQARAGASSQVNISTCKLAAYEL